MRLFCSVLRLQRLTVPAQFYWSLNFSIPIMKTWWMWFSRIDCLHCRLSAIENSGLIYQPISLNRKFWITLDDPGRTDQWKFGGLAYEFWHWLLIATAEVMPSTREPQALSSLLGSKISTAIQSAILWHTGRARYCSPAESRAESFLSWNTFILNMIDLVARSYVAWAD